jgi:DNA transformation protein
VDAEAIQDLFQDLGQVRIRRMFGGYGIYAGERMFGLAADGEIYLKADETSRPDFEAAGSRPFTYQAKGRTMTLGYWQMPEDGIDDPSGAARWARLAIEAAARAAASRPPKRRPKPRA